MRELWNITKSNHIDGKWLDYFNTPRDVMIVLETGKSLKAYRMSVLLRAVFHNYRHLSNCVVFLSIEPKCSTKTLECLRFFRQIAARFKPVGCQVWLTFCQRDAHFKRVGLLAIDLVERTTQLTEQERLLFSSCLLLLKWTSFPWYSYLLKIPASKMH